MSLRPTYISLDSPMRNEKERSDYFGAPSSPLAAPPMLPDSPDSFHSASPALTALMTPEGDYAGSQSGMLKSDHKILAALAQSSPELGSEADASENFKSGSLLPAHHPFRQKLALKTQRSESDHEQSPPHTPKGHPVEFSKLRWPKPKTHPISNPYPKAGTTLSYLRVPRRFRPIALIAFCLVVFGLIHLNNAAQQSRQLKTFSHQQAAALGRRQAELSERREVQRKAVWAQMAAAAVESLAPAPEPIAFEDTSEELAALIAFVTSTTSNALPMLDPTVPLDPSVVLDFDPTRAGAREDLDLLINEINTIYPLVLLGKMRDPWHREMKQILSEFKITPAPLVIDIDQRRDHRVFIPLLARLLGNDDLPQLLLHGKPLGSYHELVELKEKGKFASILEDGNVLVQNVKKKKKGIKERERIENERVLGPAPIKEDD